MHFKFRNVNEAFRRLIGGFAGGSHDIVGTFDHVDVVRSSSRNGDVLYIPEPVVITYTHPRERVLFNQARDCNPFFHLYEALWMLAGRNDVAPLAYYNSNIANYSDDGRTFNGAYGYRWRHAQLYPQVFCGEIEQDQEVDQLRILIDHLKAVPDSRRAVLQMWNVEDDLLKIGTPKETTTETNQQFRTFDPDPNYSKDVCCNLNVKFALRDTQGHEESFAPMPVYLDMTVDNRSNDLIWGLLGANVVHFSFLQEYMAAQIGVEVGHYHQVTNNCHVYLNDKWQPEKWLADKTQPSTSGGYPWVLPLIKDPQKFDEELPRFVEWQYAEGALQGARPLDWDEPFLQLVAQPMLTAFCMHKNRDYESALHWMNCVQADDWLIAGTNWLQKRKAGYDKRQNESNR